MSMKIYNPINNIKQLDIPIILMRLNRKLRHDTQYFDETFEKPCSHDPHNAP